MVYDCSSDCDVVNETTCTCLCTLCKARPGRWYRRCIIISLSIIGLVRVTRGRKRCAESSYHPAQADTADRRETRVLMRHLPVGLLQVDEEPGDENCGETCTSSPGQFRRDNVRYVNGCIYASVKIEISLAIPLASAFFKIWKFIGVHMSQDIHRTGS